MRDSRLTSILSTTFDRALRSVSHLLRLIVLGVVPGVLAGISSWVFLEGLDRVTRTQTDHRWLLYLLPVAGVVVGAAYHYLGGRAAQGTALLIDEIHEPTGWVPRRMGPLVLVGTWITHLFGGSAGREGTALQLSGSLTDAAARVLRLRASDRRLLLIAALGGGFGAVFGVPLAGAVFALEVQTIGRARYEALLPALTASLIGHLVVEGLGYDHAVRPQLRVELDAGLCGKVAVAGIAFGVASVLFVSLTHALKAHVARALVWPPARPVIGGCAVVGLAALFGRDYLGLSLPLIDRSLAGDHVGLEVFMLKLVFTAVTLACGFPGGEVTPLFVIGSTLGAALAPSLGVAPPVLGAIGFVAVFGAAANTPLACTVMGIELFGAGVAAPLAVGCVVAYACSGDRGIYPTQRVRVSKVPPRPPT